MNVTQMSNVSAHASEEVILYSGLVVNTLGLLLNVLSVSCIVRVRKNDVTRRQHTYFLLNILLCDVVITFSGLAFFALKLIQLNHVGNDKEILSEELHGIRASFYNGQSVALRLFDVGTTANLMGLLLMSLDHFIVVRFSLQHRLLMTSRVVFSLLAGGWALSIVLGLLSVILIVSKKAILIEGLERYNITAGDYWSLEAYYFVQWDDGEFFISIGQEQDRNIRFGAAVLLITVTFTCMLLIHSYIACTVVRISREQQRRLRNCSVEAAQVDARMRRSQLKGVCTTVLFLSSFAVLWLPTNVMYLMRLRGSQVLSHLDNAEQAERILLVIASMTGILDVAIYFLRSRELTAVLELKNKCLRTKVDLSKSSNNTTSLRNTAI